MSEARAKISERKRLSTVWIVPIVALVLGISMVIYTFQSRGPEITIVFSTAEGIEAGKTKIKVLSVEVGLVESAGLSEGLNEVVVVAQLEKAAAPLLREDTQFWVVRPRVGAGGISGLGTLLSGGYIQLAPGTGEPTRRREYRGLEDPPVTPTGTPGLHLQLVSDKAGSVGSGNPILYKGFRVGRIESAEFDVGTQQMDYRAFIEARYEDLVTTNTRFWNASGVSVSATADGFAAETGSLETILVGGVALGLPEGLEAGEPVADGANFELYPSYASVNERPYRHYLEYVVEFEQSVRGLRPGAPVEYRGLPSGRVVRILRRELARDVRGEGQAVPVLIRVDPGQVLFIDSEEGNRRLAEVVKNAVSSGMRASLATGSLLTGSLYIALDVHRDAKPAEMGEYAGRPTIPTIPSGLAGIEQKVASLLDKVNRLPLEDTVRGVNRTLGDLNVILASQETQALPAELESTLAELRGTLASVSSDSALQERLERTLVELDRTLRSLRGVLDTLDEQPNALIFNRAPGEDPRPSAGSP